MRRTPLVLLLCLAACAHQSQRASAPVRQLSEDAKAQLANAPKTYALTASTPAELGKRFETGLQMPVAHDERLDALAQLLADTLVLTSQLPAGSLTQWLTWKEGVIGDVRAVQAWSAEGDAEEVLETALIRYAGSIEPDGRHAPLRYGVARSLYAPLEAWAQVAVITSVPVELDALPKTVAPGEKLTLRGRFNVKAVKPTLFLDDDDTRVRDHELVIGPDQRFELTIDAPTKPGRRFLEVSAFEQDEKPESPQWQRPLLMLPLHVGVAEPAEPDAIIRAPGANPGTLKEWPARALALYNARRTAAGLKPLTLDPIASKLATDTAKALALSEDAPPDPQLILRLVSLGLPTRQAQQHGGRVDFLEESTALSLYSPSLRQTMMDPKVTVIGLAYEPVGKDQRGLGSGAVAGSAVFVAPVGTLEPAAEAEKLLAGFNQLRKAKGRPELSSDPGFTALAMAQAKSACDGTPMSMEATSAQANVLGFGGGLAMSWSVPHLLPADLAHEQKLFSTDGSHVAFGVCQAGGVEQVFALISTKQTAPAAPARRGK